MTVRLISRVAVGLALIVAPTSSATAAERVTVGHSGTVSEAFYFIAAERGYYADEGLYVTHAYFDSAAKEIPVLGTGELDAGSGPVSAGLFNAISRGVKIKIIGNRLAAQPQDSSLQLMVRKDLTESGRVKALGDLKGLRVALLARGIGTASLLAEAARKGGLAYGDVEKVFLPFPLQAAAFKSRTIDAALSAEPFVKQLIDSDLAVPLATWGSIYPDFQVGLMLFGEKFLNSRRLEAVGLMRALLRASRDYRAVVRNGRFSYGPEADDIARIIAHGTGLSQDIVRAINMPEIDLDRPLGLDALRKDLAFFKSQGDVQNESLIADHAIDTSVFQDAVRSLANPMTR